MSEKSNNNENTPISKLNGAKPKVQFSLREHKKSVTEETKNVIAEQKFAEETKNIETFLVKKNIDLEKVNQQRGALEAEQIEKIRKHRKMIEIKKRLEKKFFRRRISLLNNAEDSSCSFSESEFKFRSNSVQISEEDFEKIESRALEYIHKNPYISEKES